MGAVALTVADLDRSLAYYQQQIGLALLQHSAEGALLGTGERVLLRLTAQPGARPVQQRRTGLYHFAPAGTFAARVGPHAQPPVDQPNTD